jgi:hypothetical protein
LSDVLGLIECNYFVRWERFGEEQFLKEIFIKYNMILDIKNAVYNSEEKKI